MPEMLPGSQVLSWASELDEPTRAQARLLGDLPFIVDHVALMADAHLGIGATIGSVIPTEGAIVPAAVGVDIGCGVVGSRTRYRAEDLPDHLGPLLSAVERVVPAREHRASELGERWLAEHDRALPPKERKQTVRQLGTLGSGNHFAEVCLDADDGVWVLLHSGSRGIGNRLAQRHIETAKGAMARWFVALPDPDLAYLVEGTPAFDAYWSDLQWAQRYAFDSRELMIDRVLRELFRAIELPRGRSDQTVRTAVAEVELERINNHHNYTAREHHHGRDVLVTRKGAIRAAEGVLGVIPGSMGTGSYVVRGLGSAASFDSAPHGAGRRFSRREARRRFSGKDLTERMQGRTWLAAHAEQLVDEIPDAYKDVDRVIADSADLVEVVAGLRAVLNYKGT